MRTDPTLGGPAGYASTPPERIRFAYLIYENRRRNVARSMAAHEVGHILTFRWVQHTGHGFDFSTDDHECLAEAIGRKLVGQLGRTYSPGYGGFYDACSLSPETMSLANEIVDRET